MSDPSYRNHHMRFTHESHAQRVVFASGEAPSALVAEVEASGRVDVLLIASERESVLADPIDAALQSAGIAVTRHAEVVMHVPAEVAERARAKATSSGSDAIVTVGGGSTTGPGKA